MGVLGSYGDIVFEVSSEKVRTFDNFERNSADRWESHDLLGLKPKSEFIGPGLDSVTFTMWLDAKFGVNPRAEMEKLLVMSRDGEVADLTIGNKGLGVAQWKIKSLGQKWEKIDNAGRVVKSSLDVTLEEYI